MEEHADQAHSRHRRRSCCRHREPRRPHVSAGRALDQADEGIFNQRRIDPTDDSDRDEEAAVVFRPVDRASVSGRDSSTSAERSSIPAQRQALRVLVENVPGVEGFHDHLGEFLEQTVAESGEKRECAARQGCFAFLGIDPGPRPAPSRTSRRLSTCSALVPNRGRIDFAQGRRAGRCLCLDCSNNHALPRQSGTRESYERLPNHPRSHRPTDRITQPLRYLYRARPRLRSTARRRLPRRRPGDHALDRRTSPQWDRRRTPAQSGGGSARGGRGVSPGERRGRIAGHRMACTLGTADRRRGGARPMRRPDHCRSASSRRNGLGLLHATGCGRAHGSGPADPRRPVRRRPGKHWRQRSGRLGRRA